MNKKFRLKLYYFAYFALFLCIFILLSKFILDFYYLNKKTKQKVGYTNQNIDSNIKIVDNPRMQINQNNFNYVTAEKGYLNYNDDKYTFENVEMISDFGRITSGKLEITEDKNIFDFTINPNFTIYLENVKDSKNFNKQ